MSNKFQKKGFTLIELLVVISIIALLLSILMPGLQRAREMAKTIVCSSNQRSLMTVLFLYAGDFDDYLPNDHESKHSNEAWFTVMEPYFTNRGILHCPTCKYSIETLSWLTGEKYKLDIGANYRLFAKGGPVSGSGYDNAAHKLSEIARPSEVFVFGDGIEAANPIKKATFWILHSPNISASWNALDNRHSGGKRSNIAYADGHSAPAPKNLKDLSESDEHWVFWCGKNSQLGR